MCDPVTILAVTSAAVGTYGADQSAKASNQAAQRQAENQAEEQKASSEVELGERVRERNRAHGRARVAAGEAGVGGQSFALGLAQTLGDFNQSAALIQKNLSFQNRATQGQLDSAFASNPRQNALGAGLNIGSAGMQGHAQGLQIKQARDSLGG